jgi:hypothetical protein
MFELNWAASVLYWRNAFRNILFVNEYRTLAPTRFVAKEPLDSRT